MGIRNWLRQALKEDRADRYAAPGLVAHFWDGGAPKAHPVKDISLTGAYLCVKERLYAGTLIDIALRKASESSSESALSVQCKVVRHGPDGIWGGFFAAYPARTASAEAVHETYN